MSGPTESKLTGGEVARRVMGGPALGVEKGIGFQRGPISAEVRLGRGTTADELRELEIWLDQALAAVRVERERLEES